METISVGVRDAKAHLSKLLKRVQQGDEVLLRDRGRPVARIVPIDEDRLDLADRIRRLEHKGIIEPLSTEVYEEVPAPIPYPADRAQQFLQEDRTDDTG